MDSIKYIVHYDNASELINEIEPDTTTDKLKAINSGWYNFDNFSGFSYYLIEYADNRQMVYFMDLETVSATMDYKEFINFVFESVQDMESE